MDRKMRFVALVLLPLCLFACSRLGLGRTHGAAGPPMTKPAVNSPYKVRVADVSNDTHKVYDVDVIGLLWGGIENSLKERGMLWTPASKVEPYVMKAHIEYFQEGNLVERLLPYMGDTVLAVRIELSRDGKQIATIEVKRRIGYGKGTITLHAWKKIFAEVSEDVVRQAVKKF